MKPNDTSARPGRDSAGVSDAELRALLSTEHAADLLIQIVGRIAFERIDPTDPVHAPFFEWLAAEARHNPTLEERRTLDRDAALFAERIRRRIAAERAGERVRVRCVNDSPETRPLDLGESPLESSAPEHRVPRWDLAVAAGAGRDLWDEPPVELVVLPDSIGEGRYIALTVAGDSMTPLLRTGDTILVRLGPELATDHVVVARHPELGYVVKRVGRIDPAEIELTSLNDAYVPLSIPHDASLILGTVVLRWCAHERGRLVT